MEERKFKDKLGLSSLESLGLSTSFYSPFESVPYEDRSTEKLQENLKKVEETYYEEDMFYIGEELSEKLNIVLKNGGDKYLEDVSIQLKIPSWGVMVMDKIHQEPTSGLERALSTVPVFSYHYPHVEEEEGFYIVESNIGDLKHHQYTEAFGDELRVFFSIESSNQTIPCSYTIFAKNLPSPMVGQLEIEVV